MSYNRAGKTQRQEKREEAAIIQEVLTTHLLSAQVTTEILDRLAAVITRTQSALLAGKLPEIESGLAEQLALCRSLRPQLPIAIGNVSEAQRLIPAAQTARQRMRVFAAILRRMQQTLAIAQNAIQTLPLTYKPDAHRHARSL